VRQAIHGLVGADLLVHEVAKARPELARQAYIQRIIAHHMTARAAGSIFARSRPRLAVYTHLVLLASERIAPPTVADLIAETRLSYDGPLQVGEDLLAFEGAPDPSQLGVT
jgi:ribonuclease Z